MPSPMEFRLHGSIQRENQTNGIFACIVAGGVFCPHSYF